MTDRQWQLAAAHALTDLIARDLPAASWSISVYATELAAQICCDDDVILKGVAAWADFFDTKVEITEYADRTRHQVRAEHMGVPVVVWGCTGCAFTYKKVPAGEAS